MTDGGRTYTIKIKRGIYFAADPAFKGKPRELTAEDYVYTIKRIIDPKVRSYWLYLLEKNLVGLDDVLAQRARDRRVRLRRAIEGLQALDRYTLRITLQPPRLCVRVVAHHRPIRRGRARGRRRVQGREQPGHGATRSARARTC